MSKRKNIRTANEVTIKRLLANDSKLLKKKTRVAWQSGPIPTGKCKEVFRNKEACLNLTAATTSISIPIEIELYGYQTQPFKLKVKARVFKYENYDELRAIYLLCTETEDKDKSFTYHEPGIIGIPNTDSAGFVINFTADGGMNRYGEHINAGFGRFEYNAAGAEEYMRQFLFSEVCEIGSANARLKSGYAVVGWKLSESAKTLLNMFFATHAEKIANRMLENSAAAPT